MSLVLRPLALVQWIMGLLGITLHKKVAEQLVVAVSEGIGVAREGYDDRTVYAVLAPIIEAEEPGADFCPTLVAGEVQSVKRNRKVRSLGRMVRALQHEEGIFRPSPKRLRRLIPVPADSMAIVPLGGDLDDQTDMVAVTETEGDGVRIEWFTVRNVPVGGIIYRINADHKVILYQKLANNAWVRVAFDGSRDLVNLPRLLAEKAGNGNRFTSVEKVSGPRGLIRTLPASYIDRN